MSPQETFLAQLELIENVIRFIVHRHRCPAEEAEEFRSLARLKLIEDDYAVLRRFGGRSSLRTYLTTVLHRAFLDYRTQRWGRWRPSRIALRLGEVAVRLERLLGRDGHTLAEAEEILRSEGRPARADELRGLAARLPSRERVRLEGEEAIEHLGTPVTAAQELALDSERRQLGRRLAEALQASVASLPDQDRLALRLRFEEGLTVREIARLLHIEEKPLYRRQERVLVLLRESLQEKGVSAGEVEQALQEQALDWAAEESEGEPGMARAGSV